MNAPRLKRWRSRASRRVSTIYVFGELEPPELAFFDAQEIPVSDPDAPSPRVEVLGHGIAYWEAGVWGPLATSALRRGETLLRLTAAAYALLGGVAFAVRTHNWLEARGVVSYRTMVGMRSPRLAAIELLVPDDPANRVMREAVAVATVAIKDPLLRVSLRDLHTAVLEPDMDAFIYAYRAVEGVRQAIAPDFRDSRQWPAMHERLGTTKHELDDLTELAKDVRHAKLDTSRVQRASDPRERQRLFDLARKVVRAEIELRAGRTFERLTASG